MIRLQDSVDIKLETRLASIIAQVLVGVRLNRSPFFPGVHFT